MGDQIAVSTQTGAYLSGAWRHSSSNRDMLLLYHIDLNSGLNITMFYLSIMYTVVNSLPSGGFGCTFKLFIFIKMISRLYPVNRPQVNVTEPRWWYVNFGSGNGLVSTGNWSQSWPRSLGYGVIRPRLVKYASDFDLRVLLMLAFVAVNPTHSISLIVWCL